MNFEDGFRNQPVVLGTRLGPPLHRMRRLVLGVSRSFRGQKRLGLEMTGFGAAGFYIIDYHNAMLFVGFNIKPYINIEIIGNL